MSEAVYAGVVPDIAAVVQALWDSHDTFMILEQLPTGWIEFDRHQPDSGLMFARFNRHEDFNQWGRGRIFNQQAELRWEKCQAGFHAVYIGPPHELPGLAVDSVLNLAETDQKKGSYFLWGQRMSEVQLEDIRWKDPAATDIFVELQTPRLLRYPAQVEAGSRLKLQVIEYSNRQTGQLVLYRMKGIEAA